MIIMNQAKEIIRTLDEWFKLAPPARGKEHWKDGRSAKELAKAWMGSLSAQMPAELKDLLLSHLDTRDFVPAWAIPEYKTKLDHLRGSGRHHDLVVMGETNALKTLISIEAKVDEPFGERIAAYLSRSIRNNPRSQVPSRIDNLSRAIFGSQNIGVLRYQLLYAVAATLIEAKNRAAAMAAFIVHEFVPYGKRTKRALQNEESLQAFVKMLTGDTLKNGQLTGPIFVPGDCNVPGHIPLYVGKITTFLANSW